MDTYLLAKRKLLKTAEASLKKCSSEESVLETLLKTKPKALGCDNPLRTEFSDIDEEVKFYEEQFRRKGLTERSERFQYLISTLKSKLRNEPETFYSVIGFLLEMENDPTNSLEPLDVKVKHYSSEPDLVEVVSSENEVVRKRNAVEFREEMVRELKECQPSKEDIPTLDSDLSEWSSDEENTDDSRARDHRKIPADTQIRGTETTGGGDDSSKAKKPLPKANDNRKWKNLYSDASGEVKEQIRKISMVPLKAQPMIASYEDLTLKFGEFWEWHKLGSGDSGNHSIMQVVTEECIVREIIWHFSNPSSVLSPIFSDDWCLKPNIMVSTLNHATLKSSLATVGTVLRMMQRMRVFLNNSINCHIEVRDYQSSRVVEAFTHSVSQVLESVSSNVNKIYDNHLHGQKQPTANGTTYKSVSTILQMIRHCLRFPLAIVKALDAVFTQSFGSNYDEVDLGHSQAWFSSIRVLSSTEMSLKTEGRSQVWRILFYIHSQCLRAYFFEFFSPLDTSVWAPGCPFYRNESIGLHDAQFWTDCIGVQPYAKELKELGVPPTSFVKCLQTETLAIIKILEMLRLLGEDFKVILQSRVDPDALLQEFLTRVLPQQFEVKKDNPEEVPSTSDSYSNSGTAQIRPFVEYLHLSDKKVFDAFRNTFKVNRNDTHSDDFSYTKCLSAFLNVTNIPTEDFSEILVEVIHNILGPAFARAKDSLRRIFQEHKVLESLTLFQEIILGAREDFSQAVFQLAKKSKASSKFAYEPEDNRNPSFQKLLNECYPDGRETFEINFIMDSTHDLNFKFVVKPLFPLNLILNPESIKKYMFVSHQLLRIRKSLWGLNNLKLKDCKVLQGVNLRRAFLFRFSLIHFCSSLRAFLMFKILASNNLSAVPHLTREITDLDQIVKAHETYLRTIDSRLMRIKFIHAIVIQKITSMSDYLQKNWVKGIDLNYMIKLEECLKQCWSIVSDFCLSPISAEFTELFYYVGPPPSYL